MPDTGYGCGCHLCAESNAPRYERRRGERGTAWSPLRRRLVRLARSLTSIRPEAA